MQCTAGQRRVIDHGDGPARVLGGFGTGKTAALEARADRLGEKVGAGRILTICRSRAAAARFGSPATTFWDLALDIVARHDRPVRLLTAIQQQAVAASLLAKADARYLAEATDMVCHYQASYLGEEELRTHAAAAGEAEAWEGLTQFAAQYLHRLDLIAAVDWAGALVSAGLLLRDPQVLTAERDRFDYVLVDDFEMASFATHRLLSLLAGQGGNVVVAGNPGAAIGGRYGGTARYLERFPRSFGAADDIRLPRRLNPPASSAVARGLNPDSEPGLVVQELLAWANDGVRWSDMAVVICQWRRDAARIRAAMTAAGIPGLPAEGPDPWDDPPAKPADDPGFVTVASIDAAAGRHWPAVVLTGCIEGSMPAEMPSFRWLDRELLAGPDVPSESERLARWEAEERRRFDVACSRATERLVLVTAPPPGGQPSRFVAT